MFKFRQNQTNRICSKGIEEVTKVFADGLNLGVAVGLPVHCRQSLMPRVKRLGQGLRWKCQESVSMFFQCFFNVFNVFQESFKKKVGETAVRLQ